MSDSEKFILQSGALNPDKDIKASRVAERLYEQFRNRNRFDDCNHVADHTRFSLEQLVFIRDYIFENCHWLSDGRFTRFDPDYAMAESWRRLSEVSGVHIEPHDVLMLEHELYEIKLLLFNSGYSVTMAHEIAEQKYNYSEASKEYYEKLFSKQKKKTSNDLTITETKMQNMNAFKEDNFVRGVFGNVG